MGVYIKGIKMPKTCLDCDVGACICNRWYHDPKFHRGFSERHPDCPLVEVKEPHGDLIDRTALIKEARVICSYDDDGVEFECMCVLDGALVDAPTVIETEDTCDSDSCPIHFPDDRSKYDPDEFFSAGRSGK